MTAAGFPHSDILGSTLGWQLPEAYRSLPRPSSAPDAKASTMRPNSLTHKKTLDKKLQTTAFCLDARNHYPIKQTPHPTTKRGDNHQPPPPVPPRTGQRDDDGPVASKPNSVLAIPSRDPKNPRGAGT